MKEWTEDFGGKTANQRYIDSTITFKPLPFQCCSLSLQPFIEPVCTNDGVIYDVAYVSISLLNVIQEYSTVAEEI